MDADHGGTQLELVARVELDRAGDAPAVDVGAVGGTEVLDEHAVVFGEDASVTAGDAGVVEDEVGGSALAAEDQLAVEGVLAPGGRSLLNDQ